MIAPIASSRTERAAASRGILSAPRGGDSATSSTLSPEEQQEVAAQRQAFDYETAERAELVREHEVLQALLMAHLKNEDEITKKWISLI